jgi:uncharacterized membrane protein
MVRGKMFMKSFAVVFVFLLLPFRMVADGGAALVDKQNDTPARGIAVYTDYSGIAVATGESVQMELTLENKGKTDENIDVALAEVAKGWKATLRGVRYQVTGMYVSAGKTKTLSLNLDPGKGVGPGRYAFRFDARTADGKFSSTHTLNVDVQGRKVGVDNIRINAAYPMLRGQTDSKFEFSLDVLNKSEMERSFNLSAVGPEGWEISFKPAYEQKQISTLRVKEGQSQTIVAEVTPKPGVGAGEFPIIVRISARDSSAEAKLTAVLTGTYRLDVGTPNGILSLEAYPGKTASFSLFVKNSGSAPNRNVAFSSFKPENWAVAFKPEKIDVLSPGEMKQVEVTIKPGRQTLVGDYSVGVMATGEKAEKTVEMRVTVKASSAWGWIGIGLIVLVIAALGLLFVKMGRR